MTPISRGAAFDSIYVVQFLAEADKRRTGQELFDGTIRPLAERNGIRSVLLDVANRGAFLRALSIVADECRQGHRAAIVHIESHGSKSDVHGEDTERVPWAELKPVLIEINKACRMNLVVTMAACHGLNLVKTLWPTDRAPVWGLVGPDEQVLPTDVGNGFRRYYEVLLTEHDHDRAREALLEADGSNPDTWKRYTAEVFLSYVFGEYTHRELTPERKKQRVDTILANLALRGTLRPEDAGRTRRTALKQMGDGEAHFRRIRRHFLMLDLFPENEARFSMTHQEAIALHDRIRSLAGGVA